MFPIIMTADPRAGLGDAAIALPMALIAFLMPAWRPTYEVTPECVFRHRFGRASFAKTRVEGPLQVEAIPHRDRVGQFTGTMITLRIGATERTAELEKLSPIAPPELVEQVRQEWAWRVWQAQGAPRSQVVAPPSTDGLRRRPFRAQTPIVGPERSISLSLAAEQPVVEP
jgi:hypothetical protein